VTLPPNFSRAVDLSSLGKPKPVSTGPKPGLEVTKENITEQFLPLSLTKPIIILCWSERSPESLEILNTLGKLVADYEDAWVLGRVDIDTQPEVAQALQTKQIPFAVAVIGEQMVPLFEQAYPEEQVKMVIDKVLALAAQQGIGSAPVEKMEPEEEEALAALDAGDYKTAEAAYKKFLARKPGDMFALLGLAQTQLLLRTESLDSVATMQEAIKSPDDIEIQMQCADIEMVGGYVDQAFSRLLRLILVLEGAEQKLVKDRLLELFALVDPADPRVINARTALANALF
jgi:putative thioredoxin